MAVRDELAASIDATLHDEARRNEVIIANVRALLMAVICTLELVWALTNPGALGDYEWLFRGSTFVFTGVSVGVLLAMRRGWYWTGLALTVPLVETTYVLIRLQAVFSNQPLETLVGNQEAATAGLIATCVAAQGAFRMRRDALVASTVAGVFLYAWFAQQLGMDPLQILTHELLVVAVGLLAWGMTANVRRAVRSEVARLTLGRLLPETVIEGAHEDPLALLTEPRNVDATVLVTDIRGFTAWAENRSPIEVLDFLNVVQGALAGIVRSHGGMVDKFMGDGMLAVFGAPEPMADHAARAVAAAKEIRGIVERLELDVPVRIGIGVHSGELVVGCLGSGIRMEFTILGDTVNTASRLEAHTKEHDVEVLLSADTIVRVDGDYPRVGEFALRGREKPLEVFTLPTP